MIYHLSDGSTLAVHDILDPLPEFMYRADLLFVDPPYNQALLTNYSHRAEVNLSPANMVNFTQFTEGLFDCIADIAPRTCYLEIGNQYVAAWRERLAQIYPVLQHWPVVYYRKHPTNIIRGGQAPSATDFTGLDEARVIVQVAQIEAYQVMGDLCMGQGLVGLAAHAAGKPFVGTELNPRRLAVLLQKLAQRGVQVQRYG